MNKKVFKEVIIAMLLCLAIILVLGVVLYSYVPANKTLPDKVAYTTPERVEDELTTASGADTDEIVLTYEVDNSDMSNYENINSYNPGKSDPMKPFQQTKDGTIITNPKDGVNYSTINYGSDAPTASGSTNQGQTTSGTTSGTASSTGTTAATTGSANTGSSSSNGNNGNSGSSSSSESNNGGQPGYYNYKNGK